MQIIAIVLPIFLIIAAGYVLKKYSVVGTNWVKVLNTFVYYVALPALVVVSFWGVDYRSDGYLELLLFNATALTVFALLLTGVLSLFNLSPKTRAAIILATIVGNTVYMGLPIGQMAFGAESVTKVAGVALVHLVLGLVIAIMMIEYLVVQSKNWRVYMLDLLRNPLIIALIAGVGLNLIVGPEVFAGVALEPLRMLAATASPVALFALGAFLHGRFINKNWGLAFGTACLSLLLWPLIIWMTGEFSGITSSDLKISILLAAMPTAVTTFVIATKYSLNEEFIANTILIGTLLSFLSLSAVLYFILGVGY